MWDDVAPCGTCSTHCQPTANQVTFSPRAWLHLRLVFPPCPAGHCRALWMESRENFSQSPHKQRCLACFRRTISFTLPYLQKRLLPIHVLFLERDSSRLEMPLVSKCRIMQLPRAKRVWHENYETLLQIANNVPTCSNMFQNPNILWQFSGAFKRSNKSVTLVTGFLCTLTRMAKIGISRVCNTSHFSTGGLDSQSVARCLPLVGSGKESNVYCAYCKE